MMERICIICGRPVDDGADLLDRFGVHHDVHASCWPEITRLTSENEALRAERDAAQQEATAARAAQIAAGHVFADANPEAKWIEDSDNACPACGGSGHKDDAKAYEDRARAEREAIAAAAFEAAANVVDRRRSVIEVGTELSRKIRALTLAAATAALNRVRAGERAKIRDMIASFPVEADGPADAIERCRWMRDAILARADAVERGE